MSDDENHGITVGRRGRGGIVILVVAAALFVGGAVAIGVGVRAQQHAPQPPLSASVPISGSGSISVPPVPGPTKRPITGPVTPSDGAGHGLVLAPSVPTHLSIPSIDVHSDLLKLNLNADHTVQVPPQTRDAEAGWFTGSPAPGQLGPSILLGHVDSAKYGPGVFFKLGALRPGAAVSITRADLSVAVFRVDRVVSYPKDDFPTFDVYGNTDNAALRLITCGGKFDLSKHSYESNIVVYASLVSSHRA